MDGYYPEDDPSLQAAKRAECREYYVAIINKILRSANTLKDSPDDRQTIISTVVPYLLSLMILSVNFL